MGSGPLKVGGNQRGLGSRDGMTARKDVRGGGSGGGRILRDS